MNYVIAVSGTTGAGKTTLVNALAARLGDAATLFFDAYQATTVYPPDMMLRLARGETLDLREVKSPDFARDIAALKAGQPVVDPWGREVAPAATIVIEEPFGRCREGMDALLDFVPYLTIPADVSLARRVRRDLTVEYKDLAPDQAVANVTQFLDMYLNGLRSGYAQVTAQASASADLQLDGLKDTATLVQEVLDYVEGKRGVAFHHNAQAQSGDTRL